MHQKSVYLPQYILNRILTTFKTLKIFSQIPGIKVVVVGDESVSVVSEFGLKHDADSFPMEANDHL